VSVVALQLDALYCPTAQLEHGIKSMGAYVLPLKLYRADTSLEVSGLV
jgi:hypothetical protein